MFHQDTRPLGSDSSQASSILSYLFLSCSQRALLRDSVYIVMMIASVVWFIIILRQDGFTAAYWESNVNLAIGLFSGGWGFLEFATMLMNPRRRALHDYIGGTVVVNPPFIQESNKSLRATATHRRVCQDFR
jgi:hypothetical protein